MEAISRSVSVTPALSSMRHFYFNFTFLFSVCFERSHVDWSLIASAFEHLLDSIIDVLSEPSILMSRSLLLLLSVFLFKLLYLTLLSLTGIFAAVLFQLSKRSSKHSKGPTQDSEHYLYNLVNHERTRFVSIEHAVLN